MPVPEVKLNDLYQEVILDHNRHPRHFGKIEHPTVYSHWINPLCGDDYHLYLMVDREGIIKEVAFEGSGCAISKSSASIMTEALEGKNVKDAQRLEKGFIRLLTDGVVSEAEKKELGKLKIFEGVKQFPVRVKCATLIWHALEDALKDLK